MKKQAPTETNKLLVDVIGMMAEAMDAMEERTQEFLFLYSQNRFDYDDENEIWMPYIDTYVVDLLVNIEQGQ